MMNVACAFEPCSCGQENLFQAVYQRTNLPRGAKILRCFPHCCPDHLPRGFCGSSLTIRVEFTVPQADYVISAGLFVFGRFHLSHSAAFRVGDRFKLSDITASLQSEDSPHHSWVAANELPSASMNTWLFKLSPSARWLYNWDSGVAKKRRLQAHALSVAALTPVCAIGEATENHGWLQVAAVISCPPFRIISFRRATPTALAALSADDSFDNAHDLAGCPTPSPSLATAMHTARSRDLALIFSFMKRIQVRDVLELIDDIHEAVFMQLDWLDPHQALNRHNSMKAYFSSILHSDQEPTPGPVSITYRIAILATWFCLDEEVMRTTCNQIDQSVTRLPNHHQVLEIYDEYVHWIWQHVNRLLRRLELSLPDVVSTVGELVGPTELQYCLSYPSVPGFESFLAQVHAQSEYRSRNQCHVVDPASQDVINGNWMLLSPTLAVFPDKCPPPGSPSISTLPITSLLAFWRQFGAIAVHFDPTRQLVRITSLLFPRYHDSEQAFGSYLVLDRQLRHFDSFPSGEFTVTMSFDGYSFGDYIGYYDTSKRALHCNLYAWPDQSCSSTGQTNFRLSIGYALWFEVLMVTSRDGATITVDIQMNLGKINSVAAGFVTLATLPLREKLNLVSRWMPGQKLRWLYRRCESTSEVDYCLV